MTQFSTTCQILSNLYNVSDFVWWNSKRVRFWVEKFKKCHVLEKLHSKVHVDTFVPPNGQICPLCVFLKALLWKKNSVHCVRIVIRKSQRVRCWIKSFTTCQIMNWQTPPKVSDFDLKVLPRVLLWIRIIKTFQALEWKIYKVSKFGWKILPRVKFWIGIFTTCQALNKKVYNLSGFDSKFQQLTHFESKRLQPVRFCFKSFSSCQILS